VGVNLGVVQVFGGRIGLLAGVDFRLDGFAKLGSSPGFILPDVWAWESFYLASVGPLIGFQRDRFYLYVRPALTYQKVFFRKGWRVSDDQLGASFGIGIGAKANSRAYPLAFLQFNLPFSKNKGWDIDNPSRRMPYTFSVVLSLGVALRI
jgi:hypothetical protein